MGASDTVAEFASASVTESEPLVVTQPRNPKRETRS